MDIRQRLASKLVSARRKRLPSSRRRQRGVIVTGQKPCIVVFCAGHNAVLEFYRDALELPVVHHDEAHSVLDASGLLLVVHPLPETILCAPPPGVPVERKWDVTIKPMFPVASIAEARSRSKDLGGVIDAPEAEWRWGDRQCCKGHDPEGNVFEVFEPA